MQQQSLADIEYSRRKKKTHRALFLETMDQMIPWQQWIDMIGPYYPSGKRGRPTKGIETMLRMYLMQNWFNLSDDGLEDAIYDSCAMRSFMCIDFFHEQVPDSTTLLKFRHLLEEHHIGEQIFADVKNRLKACGLIMHGGTIVEATIVNAPSSTKNKEGRRDPEMHQTKKGNQWYYGMKIHSGVDDGSGYVHTITATGANVHDIDEAVKLIREDDTVMYGDSGYSGMAKQEEVKADAHLSGMEFRTNRRPHSIRTPDSYKGINWDKEIENRKSSTRCKVEHPFLIMKRQFGYAMVIYRGIAKNFHRFNVLFALANLLMCARAGRTLEPCMV